VNYRNVILEEHNTVQNYALSLAHRMVTGYLLVQVIQMQILNMVPHVRNSFERTSPFVVRIPLVPDAENALGLAQNEGKLIELREGVGRGGKRRRLFLN
jgi:hypothetical protein